MPSPRVILVVLLAFLLGLGFGRFALPAKVVTKIEVREKIVTVTETSKAADVVTLRREIDRPDGTKEIRTVTRDRSVSREEDRTDETVRTDETKTLEYTAPQWTVRAMAGIDLHARVTNYGAGVERRILGPLFLGAFGFSNGTGGISVALSF